MAETRNCTSGTRGPSAVGPVKGAPENSGGASVCHGKDLEGWYSLLSENKTVIIADHFKFLTLEQKAEFTRNESLLNDAIRVFLFDTLTKNAKPTPEQMRAIRMLQDMNEAERAKVKGLDRAAAASNAIVIDAEADNGD